MDFEQSILIEESYNLKKTNTNFVERWGETRRLIGIDLLAEHPSCLVGFCWLFNLSRMLFVICLMYRVVMLSSVCVRCTVCVENPTPSRTSVPLNLNPAPSHPLLIRSEDARFHPQIYWLLINVFMDFLYWPMYCHTCYINTKVTCSWLIKPITSTISSIIPRSKTHPLG